MNSSSEKSVKAATAETVAASEGVGSPAVGKGKNAGAKAPQSVTRGGVSSADNAVGSQISDEAADQMKEAATTGPLDAAARTSAEDLITGGDALSAEESDTHGMNKSVLVDGRTNPEELYYEGTEEDLLEAIKSCLGLAKQLFKGILTGMATSAAETVRSLEHAVEHLEGHIALAEGDTEAEEE